MQPLSVATLGKRFIRKCVAPMRGLVQKGGASGDYRLRLTAIMLRHKHSNSRGKGNPLAFCAIDDA